MLEWKGMLSERHNAPKRVQRVLNALSGLQTFFVLGILKEATIEGRQQKDSLEARNTPPFIVSRRISVNRPFSARCVNLYARASLITVPEAAPFSLAQDLCLLQAVGEKALGAHHEGSSSMTQSVLAKRKKGGTGEPTVSRYALTCCAVWKLM